MLHRGFLGSITSAHATCESACCSRSARAGAPTRRLGHQGAFAYLARGEHLGDEEALRLGLVQEVVARTTSSRPPPAGGASASARSRPTSSRWRKLLLRAAADASWDASLAMEKVRRAQLLHDPPRSSRP
jgi:enoyl-CoA hydratase/carnithine racemase